MNDGWGWMRQNRKWKKNQGSGSINRKVGSSRLCAVALNDSRYCLSQRLSSLCVSICVSGYISRKDFAWELQLKKIRGPFERALPWILLDVFVVQQLLLKRDGCIEDVLSFGDACFLYRLDFPDSRSSSFPIQAPQQRRIGNHFGRRSLQVPKYHQSVRPQWKFGCWKPTPVDWILGRARIPWTL